MQKGLSLKVMSIEKEWIYQGCIRINRGTMLKMGIHIGDIILIQGSKRTSAIVIPNRCGGEKFIHMDKFTRINAGTLIGNEVRIEKINAFPAKKVTLAPFGKVININSHYEEIVNYLINRPVIKNDIIIFEAVDESSIKRSSPYPGDIQFVVIETTPAGVVQIKLETEIEISSNLYSDIEELFK